MGEQQSKLSQNKSFRDLKGERVTKRPNVEEVLLNNWKKVAKVPQLLQSTATPCGDTLYIFGGCDWSFDIKTTNTLITLNLLNFTYKFVNISPAPTPRTRHISFTYKNKIYIYGGYTSIGPSSEIWSFSPDLKCWERINMIEEHAVHDHAGIVYQNYLYIYGGQVNIKKLDHPFRRLDLDTWKWENLTLKEDIPDKILSHTATLIDDRMVIFGGMIDKEPQNDVYIYNLTQKSWYILDCKGDIPRPRFHHLANSFGHYVLVTGGSHGKNLFVDSDVYALDIFNEVWKILPTVGDPPPIRSQGISFYRRNCLFISGGYGGKLVLDDVQELKVDVKVIPRDFYETAEHFTDCTIILGVGEERKLIQQVRISRSRTIARRMTGINQTTKWKDAPIDPPEVINLVECIKDNTLLKDIYFKFEDKDVIKTPVKISTPEYKTDSPPLTPSTPVKPKYKNIQVKKAIMTPTTPTLGK